MPVMTGNVFFPLKSDNCNINIDLTKKLRNQGRS